MLFGAKVSAVLPDGLRLSFAAYFSGTVSLEHVGVSLPGWTEEVDPSPNPSPSPSPDLNPDPDPDPNPNPNQVDERQRKKKQQLGQKVTAPNVHRGT